MLTLAEQCLERAKSFIGKMRKAASPTKISHRRVLSDGSGELSPFLPPQVFQRLQTVKSKDISKKELTPIEQASRLNQKLKANYEARLARLTPDQVYQKTSLTLSLQRQMMENLIIAKARQDALQRKMEERRLRLQEEANRRFAASGAVTAEEQEQRTLYTNVLEYEQDHEWPKLWKANIKENPDNLTLVSHLVSNLLSQSEHPVVKLLRKHQYRIYNRLYPIVSKGLPKSPAQPLRSSSSTHNLLHSGGARAWCCAALLGTHLRLSCFSQGVRSGTEVLEVFFLKGKQIRNQLLSLCLLSFECLNTASYKDLCLAGIEEAFFTPLWSALVALFRKVNTEREQAFETSMKLYHDASPGDVGVPLKLFPQDPDMQGSYPYESAVQELKLLVKDYCPQKKLECIVRTLRLICACAEEYRCLHEVDSSPRTAAIGADDLLPILSFVALQCQCPQLVSECAALEEFIHEGYLIGEEGYCLTSMQSALAYVESLHTGGAHQSVDMFI
uniref:VPS9 domain containing 1 n=1 Tax=Mastacembelus armatus TaxID=205130 RepID=A0A7N8YJC4_9TELE